MTADLHIHTTASDGWLTPQEIVDQAIQTGLKYIAITDHDTVEGIRIVHRAGLAGDLLTIIPGIEFSTDLPNHEVHILGYGIDINHSELQSTLETIIKGRHERINRIIVKLNNLGYSIDYDEVMNLAGVSVSVGRPLVARALVEKGYFTSVSDVFRKLLYKNGPAYVSHLRLKPAKIIQLIKKADGIPVLAHPGLVGNGRIINEIIATGICGLEVYHPKHSEEQTSEFLDLALRKRLLVTGGSDYHGIPSRFPDKLGVFTVSNKIAMDLVKSVQALNR